MLIKIKSYLYEWWAKLRSKIMSMTRKDLFCLVFGFSLLGFAGAVIPGKIVFSTTDSAGYRFFYYKDSFEQDDLNKDTYVLFDMYTKLRPDCWPCMVVKRIACTQGDKLKIIGRDFYCNNKHIGAAKPYAKDGTRLEMFEFNGKIPQGQIFAAGSSVDSYDSRYIGFVERKDVKAIVEPII